MQGRRDPSGFLMGTIREAQGLFDGLIIPSLKFFFFFSSIAVCQCIGILKGDCLIGMLFAVLILCLIALHKVYLRIYTENMFLNLPTVMFSNEKVFAALFMFLVVNTALVFLLTASANLCSISVCLWKGVGLKQYLLVFARLQKHQSRILYHRWWLYGFNQPNDFELVAPSRGDFVVGKTC